MKKTNVDNYRCMPWKNGAGTTVEIAVYPPNSSIDNFEWRVSRAAVVTSGCFSQFEGVDRSLALLDGMGMRLQVNEQRKQIDEKNNIVEFPGEAKTRIELIHGPVIDFNLMSRRTRCTHQLHHWIGPSIHALPNGTVILYCAAGDGLLIDNSGEAYTTTNSGTRGRVEVFEDETIQFDNADNFRHTHLQINVNSRFYCAQINR